MTLAAMPPAALRAIRAELGPSFANPQQERFFDSRAPELLYSGAMGAGKSRILCEKARRLALAYPGVTIGVFRKVAASLAATTMRTWQRDVQRPHEMARANRTEGWVEFANGSRVYFMGLDPDPMTGVPSKVGSLDLGFAFVDEAVELTESDWVMLKGRLRDPRAPWHQVAAATNPAMPTHWLKRRFTPPTPEREYLHATPFDNRFLPGDYLESLRSEDTGSAVAKRLIRGEWAAAEGVIWELPPDQVREPEGREFKRVVAGVDWGFVHAFACEVVGQTGSGRVAVIDEVYERGRTLDQVIPALQLVMREHGVSTFYADPSEPAYILQCRRAGLPVEPAFNDVDPGIQAVSKAIRDGMTVAPSCTGLLGELPGYTWAPARGGGMRERPVEVGDDACDALRYAVTSLTRAFARGWGAVEPEAAPTAGGWGGWS